MVAKKTAVHQSESGRTTGAAKASTSATSKAEETPTGKKKAAAASRATATGADAAKPAPEKAATKKAAVTKTAAAAKKTTAKKTATKKSATKKTAAKKAAVKPAGAAGAEGKGSDSGKADTPAAASAGTGEKENGVGRTGGRKGAKKTVASAAEDAAEAAKTTGATTVVAKKTQGTATATKKPGAVPKARGTAEPGELAVRPGEDPWTPEEAEEARAELQTEVLRLGSEIASAEEGLAGLMRDSGDGAGDDDADTGTKNITREHEMALAANAREMLLQTERALERLDAGTYGLCENCGNPIGKARMQAFPRATLCVECKQKQERRY
ncbi:TraR/DksA family transcriptional regulator [Streptomyces sp. NPDC051684]|uniref:TraR/DksA family transcriptional regulator n=1 Tax=Streptomyces sp. NPDC051684 TaxID=3365670 RepID=UPI00379A583D